MNYANMFNYHIMSPVVGKAVLRYQRWQYENKIRRNMQKNNDKLLSPPLLSTARMSEMLANNYFQGRYTEGVKKVAWFSSGCPIEILQALDFFIYTPDNHGAMCGAKRVAVEYCEEAESHGYSRDICSYARTDIGSFLLKKTPIGKIPKPDIIVVCSNICQTIIHWYQAMGVYYNAPVFIIDTPFVYDKAEEHQIAYVKAQLEELIPVAERIAGKKMSYRRLQEICRAGKECSNLWMEVLLRAKHRPAPITGFDAFILMGPVVAMRGEKESLAFYEMVLREIDERINNGVAAIKTEKYRILWDNLPIWYRINWLSKTLAAHGIAAVISNYAYQWAEPALFMNADNPIEGMAQAYTHTILNRSTGYKLQHMKQMVDDFRLDGVLLHSDRSCKPYSLGQIDQRMKLIHDMGISGLILECDHNDSRVFSEEQVSNRIKAFAEMLG